jgi:hypothetical protein
MGLPRKKILMKQTIIGYLIGLLIISLSGIALADAGTRNQEIAQCTEAELATWGDGQDRPIPASSLIFFYKHSGAPPWFQEQQVMNLLTRASAEWSKCGIPAQVTLWQGKVENTKGIIVVQWDASGSGGNFGQADLSQNQLSLGTQAFYLLNQRNPKHNALETLQMVLAHEMGHFYGMLAHSRRCVDVLSYYNDGKGGQCYSRDPSQLKLYPEYRSTLPTACDIQRCRILNRTP